MLHLNFAYIEHSFIIEEDIKRHRVPPPPAAPYSKIRKTYDEDATLSLGELLHLHAHILHMIDTRHIRPLI